MRGDYKFLETFVPRGPSTLVTTPNNSGADDEKRKRGTVWNSVEVFSKSRVHGNTFQPDSGIPSA